MDSKLHINIKEGRIEVEGSEEFVKEIYQDFKETFTKQSLMLVQNAPPAQIGQQKLSASDEALAVTAGKTAKTKSSSKSKGGTFQFINTDLGDLKVFYESFEIRSSKESNAIFVYYLQKKLGIHPITINHIYTCYKWVSAAPPDNLPQSVNDTKTKKGWLILNSMNDIQISHIGEKAVEFSVPKRAK